MAERSDRRVERAKNPLTWFVGFFVVTVISALGYAIGQESTPWLADVFGVLATVGLLGLIFATFVMVVTLAAVGDERAHGGPSSE